MSSVSGQQVHKSPALPQETAVCSTNQVQVTSKVSKQAYIHLCVQDYFPQGGRELPCLGRVLGISARLGIMYFGANAGVPMNNLVILSAGVTLWPFFSAGNRAALEAFQSGK